MTERYVVIQKRIGRKTLHFILDDKENKIISEAYRQKREAERICKKINKEILK